MFDYSQLSKIAAKDQDITSTLDDLFQLVRSFYPTLSRLSIALTNENKATNYFVSDALCQEASHNYIEYNIRPESSLRKMSELPSVRVINDLSTMNPTRQICRLIDIGHQSSYTSPIYYRDKNLGFIFINATAIGFFNQKSIQADIAYLSQLIASLFTRLHENQKHFQTSLAIALNMGHARDPETKEHLIRMGRYSEILARAMSEQKPEITYQFIHRIRVYAPFHDIGKYRIPDHVLFSTKRFTDEDRAIMNQHTIYGEAMIEDVVSISDNHSISHDEVQFLKNIIRHHHERYDGTGLPDRLCGTQIPLEARIVTLADVFDALLSKRAYKSEWELDDVLEYIEENVGIMFDPSCVEALKQNLDTCMAVREQFSDKEEVTSFQA